MTLQSDATGTATFVDNGTTSITNATVQQYLTSGRNWYVSIPVTGAGIAALSTATSVVCYSEPTALWKTETVDSTLNPLRGYISVNTGSSAAISFTGSLNTGSKTITLPRTFGVTKSGFNLVGNPYPSYLNWDLATLSNIETTMWYRTKTVETTPVYTFDTYNSTGGVGTNNNLAGAVTKYIPPMQAFWVRVKAPVLSHDTIGTLTFDNTMRLHANSTTNLLKAPAAKNSPQQVLRLQVSNGINSDEAIVLFNPNASSGLDDYDSQKMTNGNAAIPEIYTTTGNEQLVINGLNNTDINSELPVGFTTGEANTFTLKATELTNFDAGTQVILKDNMLNTQQDLTEGVAYSFTSDVATNSKTFQSGFQKSIYSFWY